MNTPAQAKRVLEALQKNSALCFEVLRKGNTLPIAGPWQDMRGNPARSPAFASDEKHYYRKSPDGEVVAHLQLEIVEDDWGLAVTSWTYYLYENAIPTALTRGITKAEAMERVDDGLRRDGYLLV